MAFFLRWINYGGIVLLLWCAVQAGIWRWKEDYPEWMWKFQEMVSSSYLLYTGRVTGFAYEPSWLSHQLNMLYLPYWIAATLTNSSAHRFRIWKISVENILLVGGLAALILSVSRIGWLTFLGMVAYLVILANVRFVRWINRRLSARQKAGIWVSRFGRIVLPVLITLALFLAYAGLMLGAGYALSKMDTRMAGLFNFSTLKDNPLAVYANQLVFAERLVFWQAGWDVFNDYPIFGVGLGNAGFFFPEKLSAFSWALTEVATLMYRWGSVPNIKSLWVRLLAETGVVGFGVFLGWIVVLFKTGQGLARHPRRLLRAAGLAGVLVLSGLVLEGFNMDTFALPYLWLSFGLMTAAARIASGKPGVIVDRQGDKNG